MTREEFESLRPGDIIRCEARCYSVVGWSEDRFALHLQKIALLPHETPESVLYRDEVEHADIVARSRDESLRPGVDNTVYEWTMNGIAYGSAVWPPCDAIEGRHTSWMDDVEACPDLVLRSLAIETEAIALRSAVARLEAENRDLRARVSVLESIDPPPPPEDPRASGLLTVNDGIVSKWGRR